MDIERTSKSLFAGRMPKRMNLLSLSITLITCLIFGMNDEGSADCTDVCKATAKACVKDCKSYLRGDSLKDCQKKCADLRDNTCIPQCPDSCLVGCEDTLNAWLKYCNDTLTGKPLNICKDKAWMRHQNICGPGCRAD